MTLNHNYGCFSGVGSGIAGNASGLCEVADTKAKKKYKYLKLRTNVDRRAKRQFCKTLVMGSTVDNKKFQKWN